MIIAGADEIIPTTQAQRLFELANEPKRKWEMEGRGHNEIDFDLAAPWWLEVSDFLLGGSK